MLYKNARSVLILFAHQLFQELSLYSKVSIIIILEDKRFFTDFNFHKYKLILHRASTLYHYDFLRNKGLNVIHISYDKSLDLISILKKKNIEEINYIDPTDKYLEKSFLKSIAPLKSIIIRHETPSFLTTTDELEILLPKKSHYLMHSFYIRQRKKLNILMKADGKPLGGKWNFDTENRKKIPPHQKIPLIAKSITINAYVKDAIKFVDNDFSTNPGLSESFFYPTTHSEAKAWFDRFLEQRFIFFGDYQDSIILEEDFLFHSVLSPLLNIGLLTPRYVLQKTIDYAQENKIALNNLEGFVRQLIGWREYVRGMYVQEGDCQRISNFFGHTRSLSAAWWHGKTNIEPLDIVIQKVLKNAYAHHIERLMIIGNFMLLCQIKPSDVYNWFMELFIDAYDWVMVPNVYGMSQYADGGMITSKPYISSSNYLTKMGVARKGPWQETWNCLYWNFLKEHEKLLQSNARLHISYRQLHKIPKEKIIYYQKQAQKYLKSI